MEAVCASRVRLCFPTNKTCGWVILRSCPRAHIHSHLTEEERDINGSDHCLFHELLLQTNKTKKLPLVMHVGYLRHLTPKLNQRELRALMSLINQKWLTEMGQLDKKINIRLPNLSSASCWLIPINTLGWCSNIPLRPRWESLKLNVLIFWTIHKPLYPWVVQKPLVLGEGQCLPSSSINNQPERPGNPRGEILVWREPNCLSIVSAWAPCWLANLCEHHKKGAVFIQLAAIHNRRQQMQLPLGRSVVFITEPTYLQKWEPVRLKEALIPMSDWSKTKHILYIYFIN